MLRRPVVLIALASFVSVLALGLSLMAGASLRGAARAKAVATHSVSQPSGSMREEPASATTPVTRPGISQGTQPTPPATVASRPTAPPTNGAVPTAQPPPPRGAGRADFPRGAYGKDSTASGFDTIAATGFNSVMTDADPGVLDALEAKGLKGVVWLGSWSNRACSWEHSDSWVRSQVATIAGHPAILAYYLGDEPLFSRCSRGPDAYRARTALVHSLDPGRPTFTVIQAYDSTSGESYPYRYWAGTVDILGLDVYPCSFERGCDFSEIDGAIAAADQAGIPQYWAVIQVFQDDYYLLPRPEDLAAQFDHWNKSRMSGYFVFSWNFGAVSLDNEPASLAVLKARNTAR